MLNCTDLACVLHHHHFYAHLHHLKHHLQDDHDHHHGHHGHESHDHHHEAVTRLYLTQLNRFLKESAVVPKAQQLATSFLHKSFAQKLCLCHVVGVWTTAKRIVSKWA
uniref:Uncharacterized protein n=1 Tax=Anopheles culicifacies TaxID=139723 RepID=A0A182MH22_9DIPT